MPECNAKYPHSPARCSLPARHAGSHCSSTHGVMWPNAEALVLRKGTKVRHGKRAEGVVVAVDRLGTPDRSVVVLFDSGRERRLVLRTSPLRVISTRRGPVPETDHYRRCPECGEVTAVSADEGRDPLTREKLRGRDSNSQPSG